MLRKTAALLVVLFLPACGGGGGGGSAGTSGGPAASVATTVEFTRGYAQFTGTPSATAAGDIDGDGRDDVVVVTSGNEQQLYVFYQRAAGPESASAPTSPAGSSDKGVSTAVCDVDGDGRNEILVGYAAGDLGIYKPGSDGRPALWRTLAGVGSATVLCTDVDGDGLSDVVTTGRSGVTLQVLLQRAGALVEEASYTDNVQLGAHDVGDIDGDGTPDIVFFDPAQAGIFAYLQTAPGRFAAPVAIDFARMGAGVRGLAVARLGAGKRNLVATGAQLVIATQGAAPVSLATMESPGYVRVRDINGDALPDIIVFHDGAVGVYFQNTDGTFSAEQVLQTYPADPTPGSAPIAFGDFDGDGRLDIAVASQTGLSLFFQDGSP